METNDRRPDGAFERWLRRVPVQALGWMEDLSAVAARDVRDDDPEADLRRSESQRAADSTLVRWLVREHVELVWEARRQAADDEAQNLRDALHGALDLPPWEAEAARRLAEAVRAPDAGVLPDRIRAVVEPFTPDFPWDRPEGAVTSRCDGIPDTRLARLILCAGRVLRDVGALEDAHAAFHWSRTAWHHDWSPGASDDGIRLEPFGWRWGIPVWTKDGYRGHIPQVRRMDWSRYDHVVGCGTTIRHRTLEVLGVLFDKQKIAEAHHWMPRPPTGSLPRLQGRVAVVDDVHEGQTAFTLARLYDADVVDVGVECCTLMCSRQQPICTVVNPAVRCEVYRPRKGKERESEAGGG